MPPAPITLGPFGTHLDFFWDYLRTGVELFFVLSGFLLFLPYARAIRQHRPLPSTLQFYRRRALRILPAYWVCLVVLVLLSLPNYLSLVGLADVGAHLALLHNLFPDFDSTIATHFWTMAVEAQFYLLLPLFAALIARLVGRSASVARLFLGTALVVMLGVGSRELVALATPHFAALSGLALRAANALALLVNSNEGRYLEVFGIGMCCAALYTVLRERPASVARALRLIATLLLLAALASAVWLAKLGSPDATPCYTCMPPGDARIILGPFLIGLSYASLLLAALWGGPLLRGFFELAPLRVIGLISYSVYLWHLPILNEAARLLDQVAPLAVRSRSNLRLLVFTAVVALLVLPVAYLSYEFVERPFLQRRHRTPQSAADASRIVVGGVGTPEPSPVSPSGS
jgi:peptidoglycan/LPS O-acetylase OafA/YrhL